jgi:hypothetical protein
MRERERERETACERERGQERPSGTCLTLAAMQRVRGDVTRFATNELQFNEKERTPEMRTTTKTEPEVSSLHLRDERGEKTRKEQSVCSPGEDFLELSREERHHARLHESQGTHLQEQIHWMKLEFPREDFTRHDRLQGSQHHTTESVKCTEVGEGHI